MREWVRERFMRRRSRRPPNESESTGKIGQELPTDQPAPLRPAYPEPSRPEPGGRGTAAVEAEEPQTEVTAELHGFQPAETEPEAAGQPSLEAAPETTPKLVMETQPESVGIPPVAPAPAQSPRGYVVLTIGLPGSGKT